MALSISVNPLAIFAAIKAAAAAVGINSAEDLGNLLVAFVQALPDIEKGIVSVEPFIEAMVEMVQNGGAPNDAIWDKLNAALSAGSKVLQDTAAADAQPQGTLIP